MISSINPYFGTENANDNRYKEDIVNILQKNNGTEEISLICKDIAISRFYCMAIFISFSSLKIDTDKRRPNAHPSMHPNPFSGVFL
jgi:hypothetical protein